MDQPDYAWGTDITYIRTWEGWLYLAVVMDLYSRKIVGWSMHPTLARDLVLDALLMAAWRRRPSQPVIVHSDLGSRFGSDDWRRFCEAHKLDTSMSRRRNCWDDADVFEYIEMFYNRTRRHSHLGGVSPEEFEATSNRRLQVSTTTG